MNAFDLKDRYQRLNGHFQACADLPQQERRQYVSKVHLSDADLARELESLLSYHAGAVEPTTPPPLPAVGAPKESTRTRRKRRWNPVPAVILIGGALSILTILIVQTWALGRLEDHLRDDACRELQASLDLRVSGIRAWAARQKEQTQKVLTEPDFVSQVATLVELGRDPEGMKERLLASPAYQAVSKRMSQVPPELGGRGYIIISPAGIDLCAESDTIVGRAVAAAGAAYVRRINLGEWIVSRPYPDRQFALGLTPDYSNPVMFVGGPIYDATGQVLAMGFFRFSPLRFYESLAPDSLEYLAFDEKSLLLNDIGNAEALRKLGAAPESGTAFRTYLRDPGVDLQSDARPATTSETWPPTLMSRMAVQGASGLDSKGHRDLRGQTVLAAWTWLPEWEMGVGCQKPLERILEPAGPVKKAFHVLVAIPAFLTVVLLVAARHLRFRRRGPEDSAFGSYVLERPIGRGGMAEVFLARHAYLKRPAAVKILSQVNPDAVSVERFEREARLASRLGHPNTIQVLDYGETPDGRLFFAMEYVKGLNLGQLMTLEGTLSVARAVYLLKQIAGSLEEAHQVGLLHRDLKPSNIMVGSKGGLGDVVKVLDFGIACSFSVGTEDYTRSTTLVGTPAFLAPERIRTPNLMDLRSDIYAFGAVAFHLLTGRNVFEGSGPTELLYQVMTAPRPSPSQLRGERIPAALETLILDCLAVEPTERPSSFRDVQAILSAVTLADSWSQDEARAWWAANRDKVSTFLQATTGAAPSDLS